MDCREEMVCCFTGHRNIGDAHAKKMPELLDRVLESLIQNGYTTFRTGGAIGFDTIVALKVLEKREQYPTIRLELYLPCRDQTKGWNSVNRNAYQYVLSHADEVYYTRDTYEAGCMLERNRSMVQGSRCCVGYCLSEQGGSAYTLRYAKKHGLRVLNLAPILNRNS